MSNRGNEHYTREAKRRGLLARSYFKLEEIDEKYSFFNDFTQSVFDIGCAPGSWLQYISSKMPPRDMSKVIGFDLKPVGLQMPHVKSYVQDITDSEGVASILESEGINSCDVIVSDMAPDTIGTADIDALRSIGLIEKTLRIYDRYLKPEGKFAIKVFMGPGFDELVRELKSVYGASNICTFKPKSCRKKSKEIYIIKKK